VAAGAFCENRLGALSPDGLTVAVLNANGSVLLGCLGESSFDTASSAIEIPPAQLLAFSPDAECLACAHEDGSVSTVCVSDARQVCLAQALPHTNATQVSAMAYRDTETLVIARASGEVEVWDMVRLQRLFEFPAPLENEACKLLHRMGDNMVCVGETRACILQIGN